MWYPVALKGGARFRERVGKRRGCRIRVERWRPPLQYIYMQIRAVEGGVGGRQWNLSVVVHRKGGPGNVSPVATFSARCR